MKNVIVITVTYNEAHNLTNFFQSINFQTYKCNKIVVFDNNSSDDTKRILKKLYPDVLLLEGIENIGFARAVNICFKKAKELKADYIFILNNDVKLSPNCIEELLNLAEEKKTALVGPLLLKWDGHDNIIQEYGGEINVKNGKKVKFFTNENLNHVVLPEVKRVTFIGGGVLFVNMGLLGSLDNLFDDRYFLYTEEMDLQTELIIKKYKMYVTTRAKIWHKVHDRSSKQKFREYFYITRNMYLYLYKYFGLKRVLAHFLLQILKLPKNCYVLFKNYGIFMVLNVLSAHIIGFLNIKGRIKFKFLD